MATGKPATRKKPATRARSQGQPAARGLAARKSLRKQRKKADADVPEAAKVEPPPPEVAKPEAAMSPEEAERARKSYLLKRFWVTARGFWGKKGDAIAWLASSGLLLLIILYVGAQYGINVWNRKIFDA